MPRKGTMQVNITFKRSEADLYNWLVTVAGKDGISDYIKKLIQADMLQVLGISAIAARMIVEKAFSEWIWCERCGSRAQPCKIRNDKPDEIEIIYWCEECGMGYKKVIKRSDIAGFDEIRKIIARARGTISDDAEKRYEAVRKLSKRLKGKEFANMIL